MRFEAVFFDAGETLVHPHPTFAELFSGILKREGFDVEPETITDRIHVVFDRFREAARTKELWTTTREKSQLFWHDVYAIFFREIGIPDSDGLIDTVYREFTDLANYSLFDDVVPVLGKLRDAGLKLGVVSNFEEWLERLLARLGVTGFFDVLVISGTEGVEKPDPRIFRLAVERADVSPERSAYVGDNPEFDVDPAAAAGLFPVLLDRRERFPEAAGSRITTLDDLPTVLGL